MIEAQLRTWLMDEGVNAQVYPVLAVPQGAGLPLITYQRISTINVDHLGGTTDQAHARIQLNITARSVAAARTLAEQVRLALDTRTSAVIEVVRLLDEADLPAAAMDGSNQHYHTVRQDYSVWYRRAIPKHEAVET